MFDWVLYTLEGVAQRCSAKKLFLEISQNLHENTCAMVPLQTQKQKWLQHRYIPENIAKSLRTPFFYRTPLVAASVNAPLVLLNIVSFSQATGHLIKQLLRIASLPFFNFINRQCFTMFCVIFLDNCCQLSVSIFYNNLVIGFVRRY